MKKFEEEVKRPSNAGIDPFSKRDVSFEKLSSKFIKGAQTLKEWKDYAFKAEDRIRELEFQLEKQQPKIPEVPLFVGDCLALIEANNYMITYEQAIEHKEALTWLEERHGDLMLPKCLLYGYTVAKEKRFYLKHIDMSKKYNSTVCVLAHGEGDVIYGHYEFPVGVFPSESDYIFTQQEIDSMETGSYEQIEVEE
ncbi:DUF1642 domain-containing protein [Lactococcus petauri]|uniref:DUF1642 domain-containing protein n=1 Tax=Lactococcus petauri TaxID=1940789 RepID=UPI0018AB636E|nr:DUF1642 domain-containing protein [Lactococcus petauri]MDC0826074.1 DUF1642 domain-containing protein [Lactococcus petauri]